MVLVIIAPSGATPFPMVIGGQVTGMNETNHTMTITADCNLFSCSQSMTGSYEGTVTNDAVFREVLPGDYVTLMYQSWLGQYPCEAGEFKGQCTLPWHDTIPVGRWAGISRVVQEPGDGRWLTSDIFGDPSGSQEYLIHNYSFEYEPGPDTGCPVNQPVWECRAGYVNISLLHGNSTVAMTRVMRNTTWIFENPDDKTRITFLLLGGRATTRNIMSPGGGPYVEMEVHIQPTPIRNVQDSPALPGSHATTATKPAPLARSVTITASCIAGILVILKNSKRVI